MKQENETKRTIRLPEGLREAAAKRAAEERRSLQQHIVFLLEKDVRDAARRRPEPVLA